MLYRKTREQLVTESLQSLSDHGVITNLNPGGIARSLLEIVSFRLGELHDAIAFSSAMKYPTTAIGVYLDLIGDSVGIRRIQPSKAFVSPEDKAVRFFVQTGRLVDKIPTKTIPAGTRISNTNQNLVFIVTNDAVFSDVATEVFVGVEAVEAGTSHNVGVGVLKSHNINADVLVRNVLPIGNGREMEDDESYRFRLVNSYLAVQQSNPTALQLAALSIPDVSRVGIREYSHGVGSFEVLLIPAASRISKTTIQAAQRILDLTRAAGVKVSVREPEYVTISVTIKLIYQKSTSPQQQLSIAESVQANIIDYIDDIGLGGTFVINELRQRVMGTDQAIFDMKIPCYMINGRKYLPVNYKLGDDELFVLDPENPIKVE